MTFTPFDIHVPQINYKCMAAAIVFLAIGLMASLGFIASSRHGMFANILLALNSASFVLALSTIGLAFHWSMNDCQEDRSEGLQIRALP